MTMQQPTWGRDSTAIQLKHSSSQICGLSGSKRAPHVPGIEAQPWHRLKVKRSECEMQNARCNADPFFSLSSDSRSRQRGITPSQTVPCLPRNLRQQSPSSPSPLQILNSALKALACTSSTCAAASRSFTLCPLSLHPSFLLQRDVGNLSRPQAQRDQCACNTILPSQVLALSSDLSICRTNCQVNSSCRLSLLPCISRFESARDYDRDVLAFF